MATEIAWTDETWNPTVGCSRVSPGCDRCYAIDVAHRALQPAHEGLTFRGIGHGGNPTRPDWTGEVRLLPDRLDMTNTHITEVRIDRANRVGLIFWAQEWWGGTIVKSEGFRRPQDAELLAKGWAATYGATFVERAWAD